MLLAAARRSCSRALALPGTETSAGAPSLVAVRLPGSPLGGVLMAGAVRHVPPAAQVSSGAFAASGGVSCLFRRGPGGQRSFCAEPRLLSCAVRGWLPPVAWLWRGCCAPPRCCFPRTRSILRHTGAGAATRQHRQQAPAASPTKKSFPGKRAKDPLPPLPVPRRESPVVVVAVPPRRPRLAGTDASTAPPLPPTPCPVGFVQNPSSERPPTRLQSETKHYGVRQDLARTVQRISIKVLPAR